MCDCKNSRLDYENVKCDMGWFVVYSPYYGITEPIKKLCIFEFDKNLKQEIPFTTDKIRDQTFRNFISWMKEYPDFVVSAPPKKHVIDEITED